MSTRVESGRRGHVHGDARGACSASTAGRHRSIHASAVVALVLLGAALLLALGACGRQRTPEEMIVGEWANTGGGRIHFYADGTGFIPGDETLVEPIPPTSFEYYFVDDTHLGLAVGEQDAVVMEIRLERDKMTWLTLDPDVKFVYRRVK